MPRGGEGWLLGHRQGETLRSTSPLRPGGRKAPSPCIPQPFCCVRTGAPRLQQPQPPGPEPRTHSLCFQASSWIFSGPPQRCRGAGSPFSPSPVPAADFSARRSAEAFTFGLPAQSPLLAASPSPSNGCSWAGTVTNPHSPCPGGDSDPQHQL